MVALYDLSGNYVGEGPMPNYGGTIPQGTKRNKGDMPAAYNSNSEPWPGAIDQTAYKSQSGGLNTRTVQTVAVDPFTGNPIIAGGGGNRPADIIQNIPAPQFATAPKNSTIDAANPMDVNRLGLTHSPFETPATEAIDITIRGGNKPKLGTTFMDQVAQRAGKPMVFSPTTPPGPAPAGDPWGVSDGGSLRIGSSTGADRTGMVTSNRAVTGALANRGAPTPVSPQVQAALIAQALGGHPTDSPEAFAADVTRPSNIPGVEAFAGKVEQGQAGQNRYGSTARNELLRLYT